MSSLINTSTSDNKRESSQLGDDNANIGSKAKKGIFWTIFYDGFQFVFRFFGSIVLARVLFPEDFGLMAIVSIVIQLSRRLTNFGFTMVIVQRKEIQREHLDTVFITNFVLMGILIACLYFFSPAIAEFFNNQKIEPIVKAVGIYFFIAAFTSVPITVLKRQMKFQELAKSNTMGQLVSTAAPVGFALAGFGVWSLVFGLLLGILTELTALLIYSKWFPRFTFHMWALRDVFSFGLWFYIGGFINYGINKVDFFIVGKFINVVQLGFYERAFNLMSLPRNQLALKVNSVMFSTYSRIQDDDTRTVQVIQKMLLYISIITYPLMTWMFFVAPSLILLLFGDKWVATIYPFQIMCIAGVLDTLTLTLYPIALARGLVGNRARRDFIYLIVLTICVIVGSNYGISGVAWGTTCASIFRLSLMMGLVSKALPFTAGRFIRAQRSALVYNCTLIVGLYGSQWIFLHYLDVHSVEMFISMSGVTVVLLLLSHTLIRFKDIDGIIQQTWSDIKGLKSGIKSRIART